MISKVIFFLLFSIYFFFYLKTILSKKEFHEKMLISLFAIVFFYVNFVNFSFILEMFVYKAQEHKFLIIKIINSFRFEESEYYYKPFFNNIFKNFILFFSFFLMLIISFIYFCCSYVMLCLFIAITGSTILCTALSFSLTIYIINLTFL